MSFPIFLVSLVAYATVVLSASVPASDETNDKASDNVETFDSYAVQSLPQQLPLTFQLPREDSAAQFYPAQPVPYLSAPEFVRNPQPNFYEVPVPSEYLTAPTEGLWNPENDPTLYFELPASITKENVPTNEHPKKFNKDVHTKSKPLSNLPKQEIALEPINQSQYLQKQKQLFKTVDKLSKKENQKNIELEKVPRFHKIKPKKKNYTRLQPTDYTTTTTKAPETNQLQDSSASQSTFGLTSEPEHYDPNKFTKGLSSSLTDSLGIPTTQGIGGGQQDRVMFHMAGHDGPMSYKWGYDTGKGHNRQFRFEERDKEGIVKGQYGYYDNDNKFRMMNYHAHPETGFHMEPAPESEVRE